MNVGPQIIIPAALLLGVAACTTTPAFPPPQSYEQPTQPPPQAPPQQASSVFTSEGGTLLDQLQSARTELDLVRGERDELTRQVTTLDQTLRQVQADNAALQELVDSFQHSQESTQSMIDKLEERSQTLETELRDQIDQILTERIQRLRVERELVLTKIAEAERIDDG